MTIFKKLLMSAPVLALALASSGATAGHHEKGEKMADKAKMSEAKKKLMATETKMDEAEVKAKLDEAQREADMQKLHDDDSKLESKPE